MQFLLLAAAAAQAIDIPMDARLANELLDSKSCYAVLTSKGQLVGYEMAGELFVSSGARLLVLPASTNHDVGDGLPRHYEGEGLRFDITPKSDVKTEEIKDVSYVIKERAAAVLSGQGKRRQFNLDVRLSCSP